MSPQIQAIPTKRDLSQKLVARVKKPNKTAAPAPSVRLRTSLDLDLAREAIEESILPDLLTLKDQLSRAGVPVKVWVSDLKHPIVMGDRFVPAWTKIEAIPLDADRQVHLIFAGEANENGWNIRAFAPDEHESPFAGREMIMDLPTASAFIQTRLAQFLVQDQA